jgi:RNA polymerase primary sigma factor
MTVTRADVIETGYSSSHEPPLREFTWPGMDFVYDASFTSPSADEEYFPTDGPDPVVPRWVDFIRLINAEDLADLPAPRVLSAGEERRLFLRYNYARWRIAKLVDRHRHSRDNKLIPQIERWHARVMQAQADLVQSNMGLVPAMAKRVQIPGVEFDELISEGNMAILRCLDKFDVARGYKFSTYACSAILKSFHRLARKTQTYRQHFPANLEPELEQPDVEGQARQVQWEDSIDWVRAMFTNNEAELTELEQQIIMERFALVTRGKGRTLMEISQIVGLSTERVRQLLNRALQKIHTAMDRDALVA